MGVYNLTAAQMVEGLRQVADFFEANPADIGDRWAVSLDAYNLTAEQIAMVARTPGMWEKGTAAGGEMFMLSREIGPLTVEVHADRAEVCEARPTGRKTTVKRVVAPAVYEDVEIDELEWDCHPILANGDTR